MKINGIYATCIIGSILLLSACSHKIAVKRGEYFNIAKQRHLVFEQKSMDALPTIQYRACDRDKGTCHKKTPIYASNNKKKKYVLCKHCLRRSTQYFTKDCLYPASMKSIKAVNSLSDLLNRGSHFKHNTLYFGNDVHSLNKGINTTCQVSANSLRHYASTEKRKSAVLSFMVGSLLAQYQMNAVVQRTTPIQSNGHGAASTFDQHLSQSKKGVHDGSVQKLS